MRKQESVWDLSKYLGLRVIGQNVKTDHTRPKWLSKSGRVTWIKFKWNALVYIRN